MSDYFVRLVEQSPTRVWVNNPTMEEIGLALDAGAVGCTTNPAYAGGLLKRMPDHVVPLVDAVIADVPHADVRTIAKEVQARLIARIADRFISLYEGSQAKWGHVSIQGSPEEDADADSIWDAAQAAKAVAPNVIPKIPATAPGLSAFRRVVERGWAVIVTEVFSVDQLAAACSVYEEVTAKTGSHPRFFIAPITGILGDHLKKLASQQGLDIPPRILELAGVGLARRCATLVRQRNYPVTLLFGGARIPEDLTGLVGERHCATINWGTFAEIRASDPPVEASITKPFDAVAESRLLSSFSDVWKGWELGRLTIHEFEEFGPVQHFKGNFLAGWQGLVEMVAERRKALAPVTS